MGTFNEKFDIVAIGKTYDLLRDKSTNQICRRANGKVVPVYNQSGSPYMFSEFKELLAELRNTPKEAIAS